MPSFKRRKGRGPRLRSTPAGEHRAVLLDQVLEVLAPKSGEVAVDCTLGNAGHAVAILQRIGPAGKIIGLDWDGDNLPRARERLAATGFPFSVHQENFAALPRILFAEGVSSGGVDLLLADLGMSSMQVDDSERGFSYVRDGPLDMRMDRTRGRTASEILATISEVDLARALSEFGDESDAERIAHALVEARSGSPLGRTSDVTRVIAQTLDQPVARDDGWRLHPKPTDWKLHPAARTFQALRLLVNREIGNLEQLLRVLPPCLRPRGRAAIISFHSGEDRIVKAAFRDGLRAGIYEAISPEPLRATEAEKGANPRARSAKLRWARRATD